MSDIQIDLSGILNEVNNMSLDELKEKLVKARTRQKVQAKKNQGSASQKAYQQRQREKQKLLIAKAKELGLWDEINEQASKQAEAQLEDESPVETFDEE